MAIFLEVGHRFSFCFYPFNDWAVSCRIYCLTLPNFIIINPNHFQSTRELSVSLVIYIPYHIYPNKFHQTLSHQCRVYNCYFIIFFFSSGSLKQFVIESESLSSSLTKFYANCNMPVKLTVLLSNL